MPAAPFGAHELDEKLAYRGNCVEHDRRLPEHSNFALIDSIANARQFHSWHSLN
jgi:hypothetical protein